LDNKTGGKLTNFSGGATLQRTKKPAGEPAGLIFLACPVI